MMKPDRIAALAADNEALREQLRQIKAALGLDMRFPAEWKLTRRETALLGVLAARKIANKEALMVALYGARHDPPDDSIIRVFIYRLRGKLKAHGIAIHNEPEEGWFLEAADRARLREHAMQDDTGVQAGNTKGPHGVPPDLSSKVIAERPGR